MLNTVARLDELLSDRGLSLFELARRSGVNYNTFDSARRRNNQLSLDTIERVCETLQIPVYEFFMSDEDWKGIEAYALDRSRRRQSV